MRNFVLLTIEFIVLIILFFLYFVFMPSYFSVEYLSLVTGLVAFSLLIFSFKKVNPLLSGNMITITIIFIISFIIVHFQFYIDYIFGLRGDLALTYYLDYNIIPKSVTISAISLVAFFIGSLLYNLKNNNSSEINYNYKIKGCEFSFNFINLLIFLFFSLFIVLTPVEYFKGGYHDMMNDGGISYLQYKVNHLLQVCIWAYLICYTIKMSIKDIRLSFLQYLKRLKPFFLTILTLYFILNAIGGDRGPIVIISVMLVAGYFVSQKKKINIKLALLTILISALMLQFIAFLRITDGDLNLFDRINQALVTQEERKEIRADDSIFPVTTELAGSLRAYHAAVMDQEYNDILYGKANIGYIISIIPGLGLVIKDIANISFMGTAEYITDVMGAGHGMGTTVLADTYLNYGFYGSILIFLFFGYFFSKLDNISYLRFSNSSLISQILFLLFVSFAIVIGRSTFIFVLGNVLLVYVVIKISMMVKK